MFFTTTLLSVVLQAHDSPSTVEEQFARGRFDTPQVKRVLLLLPFVFLYLWFRVENYSHSHPALIAGWALVFIGLLWALRNSLSGRVRVIFLSLWFGISCLVIWDLVQQVFYEGYSRDRFLIQASENTEQVKKRATRLLDGLESESERVEKALADVDTDHPENIPIGLSDRVGESKFWWGVYNSEGRLLAWNGQVRPQESLVPEGSREADVEGILHQQFLKIKRAMRVRGTLYILAAYEPLAADYGIENQYLHAYNRLTDGLPIRPLLLYNSESSARSQDVVIQNVHITPEFSISALYEKIRYQEFLQSHIHRLHWWLEFLALCLFVFTSVYLTFEFVGVSVLDKTRDEVVSAWIVFCGVSLFSALSVAEFSSFGARLLFNPGDFSLAGNWGLFRSPGHVLFTAFFSLNLMFSLVLLSRKIKAGISWKRPWLSYILAASGFMISGLFVAGYFSFMRAIMSLSTLNLINVSMLGMSLPRLALILGIMWLDLSVVFLLGTFYAFLLRWMPRATRQFFVMGGMVLLAAATFVLVARPNPSAIWPVILLCSSLGSVVFFLPRVWPWFERINPLSRFFAVLLAVSAVSFLFHAARFHYSMDLQEEYIRHDAARQVMAQEATVQEMLRVSTDQLDDAVKNLTLDPRIPDLPYRLWLRTQFARSGYKSAVELFNSAGDRLNGFSLRLPSLHNLDITRLATGTQWVFQPVDVSFGNMRRQIFVAVRRLENAGYITVQAMEDTENLPFVPSVSPLQETFRAGRATGGYIDSLNLCIYDTAWHPVFASDPESTPSVEQARYLLKDHREAWVEGDVNGHPVRAYFFLYKRGAAVLMVPKTVLRTRIVQIIDLFLLNLMWLSVFSLILRVFFGGYLSLHFQAETSTRFSFYQKLLIAFLVFSMVPMLFLSYLIRNYVWDKKTAEVTSRALYSFSVASRVFSDYLFQQGTASRMELFDDDTVEWIGVVSQQDVSVYFEGVLIATSTRDFYTAGLLGTRLQGSAYVDLFLKGKKYSFGESQIGGLSYLNVSGRVHRGRFKDEVITIPFLIDRKSVEEEIIGLREYMMLAGAGLILFAVLIGWFLAGRFVRPVQVLIDGTAEMARGNLRYRLPQQYRDEFQQLVNAFNAMANSLDEQQQALERRRQYIENILNNITTAVISINSTMNIATVNPAAADMLGVHPSERGLLQEVVSRPGTWPELAAAVGTFLASPRELQVREVAEYRTNRELHFRLVYVPLFQQQEWVGAVLLVEDISDIIQSNRLAAFAEMARRVAHEVKNPLTPIQLAMEHLVRVYEDRSANFDSVLRSCSDAVLKQVKALRRLVSDFSQYGRPAVLNRVDTDIHAVLEDIVKSYEAHLPQGIRMETDFAANLPRVRIDVEKLRGALTNIIENGLQAMSGSGTIMLRAEATGHEVSISVHDTGAGVPPEILPRLFEPYFSTKSGGTGLGLAIARKNIEDHGGSITVESSPGKGTTVIIALPVERVPREHDAAAASVQ